MYEIETRILPENTAEWLAGILSSPEIYIEQPGLDYYLPAMISDGKVTYANTEEVGAILKLSISLANDKITPRN